MTKKRRDIYVVAISGPMFLKGETNAKKIVTRIPSTVVKWCVKYGERNILGRI
jgi:hypothetical protein